MILVLLFRPLIHFELILVYGVRRGSTSFPGGYPVVPAPFDKGTILPPKNDLNPPGPKSIGCKSEGLFLDSLLHSIGLHGCSYASTILFCLL